MATDRNPDISREQSVRFTAPAPSTGAEALAAGATQVAEAVIDFRQGQITSKLEDELLRSQEEALLAVERKMNAPDTGDAFASLSEGEAMSLQEFTERMSDLQAAANQGTSSMTQLKIRQEKILRDYMSRYPALRPRFQQAANGVLGYSPIGARVRAAEEASQGGGGGMPPILSLMVNQAVQAGVDATLYVRNPTEFWAQAQHKLSLRQQVTTTDQVLASIRGQVDLAEVVSRPEWAQFTAAMSELMWGEELMPVISAFYEDLELTPEMSPQQRQSIIEGAINDGRYRSMQLSLMQEREQWVADMYNRYQGTIGTTSINGAPISVMTFEQFKEKTAPIMEQYNWAIANIGDPQALAAMEMFNKARSQRIISGMPDNLVTLSEMGKLFGADNTFSSILTQGQLGDTASIIVSDFLNRQFGGVGASGEGGRGTGTVAPPPARGGPSRPQAGDPQSRLLTIDEVVNMTGAAREDADEALAQINQRLGHAWLDAHQSTKDPVYAIGAWTLAKEYGNMVERAYTRQGTLPSKETDNIMLELVSDPRFAQAAIAGTRGSSDREASMQDLVMNLRRRAGEEVDEALGKIVTLMEGEMPAQQTARGPRRPTAPADLAGQVAKYLDFEVDHQNFTLEFSVKSDAPSYSKQVLENLVARLNRDVNPAQEQAIVRLAMGTAHVVGVSDPRAYRSVLEQVFGMAQ